MAQVELWKVFTSLGVPGLALGVFYMLFRKFEWQFSKVPRAWVGPIVILFLVLTAGIIFYALTLWAPTSRQSNIVEYKGVVVDAYDSEPLWKAAIKYASNGVEKTVSTDSFGNYKISIDLSIFYNTGTLTVSTNGYKEKELHLDLHDYKKILPKIGLEKILETSAKSEPEKKSLVPDVNNPLAIKTDIFSKAVSPRLWFQEAKYLIKSSTEKGSLSDDDVFSFKRKYNSSNYRKQLGIGKGWTHQFASRISIEDSTLSKIIFWDKSGRKIIFKPANPISELSNSLKLKSQSLSMESRLEDVFLAENKSNEAYFLSNIRGLIYFGIRMDVAQLSFVNEYIKIKLSSNERYIFNRDGRLIEINEKSNPKIFLRYDPVDQSKLVRVTNQHADKFLNIKYNDKETISQVLLHDGTVYKYEYDPTGSLLTKVFSDDGLVSEYKYDSLGRMTYISYANADELPLVISYNDVGWRIKETRGQNHKEWSFLDTEDYSEVATSLTDLFSTRYKTYVFDNENNVLSIKDNENVLEYKLTECGCLPLEVKSKHEKKNYEYNELGYVSKIVTDSDTTKITYHKVFNKITSVLITDNETKEILTERLFEYTKNGNLGLVKTENGLSISLTYDKKSRITNMSISEDDGEINTLEFQYNDIDKPVQIKLIGVGEINVTYDEQGEIKEVNSSEGHTMAIKVTQAFQSLLSAINPGEISIDTRFNQISAGI